MKSTLVVISPPGGVGQVTAVKAATMGNTVKWFVVSSSSSGKNKVALSPQALEAIQENGGSVELAGASATTLLNDVDDTSSSINAITTWCNNADGLVCTMDGVLEAAKGKIDQEDPRVVWENAIKVAANQASKSIKNGMKLAIMSANDDLQDDDMKKEQQGGGVGDLLKSVVGGSNNNNKVTVPSSLSSAMSAGGKSVVKLRHGDLFGIPESSVRQNVL